MKILYVFLVVLAILCAVGGYFYLNYFLPIKGMAPTGEFNVGVRSFDFEYVTKTNAAKRKLNIRAWYPTRDQAGQLDMMQSPKAATAVVKIFGMPKFLATSEPSHSYIEAEIATNEGQSKYPVIVFNHGFASFYTQNTVQMQELASHGYIVLSIAHPDISLVTEYADGGVVDYDASHPAYKAFASQATELEVVAKQLAVVLNQAEGLDNFEQHWRAVAKFSDIQIYADLKTVVVQWVEDTNEIVNLIAKGEGAKLSAAIGGYMSPDKIGVLGHSLGGVTSVFANFTNDNIVAAVNLDAPPIYTAALDGLNLDKSTCHIMSDKIMMGGVALDFRQINRPMLEKSSQFGCNAIFKGSAHLSFTDMNYVGVMKLVGQLGKVDQQKMGEELNHMTRWYFDRRLKNNDDDYVPKHADISELELFNE